MQKKLLVFFFLSLPCLLGAQDKPRFSFDKKSDTLKYTKADKQLAKFEWKGTPQQKTALFNNFSQNLDNGIDIYILAYILNQKVLADTRQELAKHFLNKGDTITADEFQQYVHIGDDIQQLGRVSEMKSISEFCKPIFCDFDANGSADLIALPAVYFGPSSGYHFFAKRNNRWQMIFQKMGVINDFQQKGKEFWIHFVTGVIDPSETLIYHTIHLNLNKDTFTYYKSYTSTQTEIPTQKLFKDFLTTQETELCVLPTHNLPKPSEDEWLAGSKTLKENVVAIFPKGSKGYILATKEDWNFVLFLPESLPTACSLRHGMDTEYNKDFEEVGPKIKPYLAGWIKK
jgi:hypothetical protein